jgi:hypothetical protein
MTQRYDPSEVCEALLWTARSVFTPHEQLVLAAEVRALRQELETERMRLAAVGVVAHGAGEPDGLIGAYDSDTLRAVQKLRATLEHVEALRSRWLQSSPDTRSHACALELHDVLAGGST